MNNGALINLKRSQPSSRLRTSLEHEEYEDLVHAKTDHRQVRERRET